MRKFFIALLIFVIFIILALVGYLWSNKRVISGYAAKKMCACVFLADRNQETVTDEEFDIFPNKYTIKHADVAIDKTQRVVTATFWGGGEQQAVYREGLGCTLRHEKSIEQIQNQAISLPLPPYNPDTLPWPTGNILSDTIIEGVDYDKLTQAVAAAFDDDPKAEAKRTRAVLVIYKDHIIAEQYATGFDVNTRQHGWSMTKSIVNAMVGILVKQGKLSLDQQLPFPSWQADARDNITLNHLMQMSSGLEWNEGYLGSSDVTHMLYYEADMAGYVIEQPTDEPPNEDFTYSSGTTNIISYLIRQQFNTDEAYYRFPYETLFHKIGMTNTLIEADASGTFVGSSFGWGTARDWGRFGLLYLNEGVWEGDTILPEGWVAYTTTPTPPAHGYYGAQFWLNQPIDPPAVMKRFRDMPDIPRDTFIASGHDGQRVFIIPSYEVVIVRLGLKNLNDNDFVSGILSAIAG